MLREAKEYADQTMKLFHKFQKDHVDLAAVEKERQNLRKRMDQAGSKISMQTEVKKPNRSTLSRERLMLLPSYQEPSS